MRIQIEKKSPWTVVQLDGRLVGAACPELYQEFQRELLAGYTHFLFDLADVDIVDSPGLGVLVRCYRDARGRGGEVGLTRVPDSIARILEFTRLDTIFRITESGLPALDEPDQEAA